MNTNDFKTAMGILERHCDSISADDLSEACREAVKLREIAEKAVMTLYPVCFEGEFQEAFESLREAVGK